MQKHIIGRGMIQVGPNKFMDPVYAQKHGLKPYKPPPAQAAHTPAAPTARPSPPGKTAPPAPDKWSKRFSAFAKTGDYSLSAAMNSGFDNTEIRKMVADGWITPPANRGVAVQTMGANYQEALRRGLV